MSWLRRENMPPSDYDPEKQVEEMTARLGQLSVDVLGIFNDVDPFHVFFGNNVDEYTGYVERFFQQLGDRKLVELTDQDITATVRDSFTASQIEQGFVDAQDLEQLSQKIIALRDTK